MIPIIMVFFTYAHKERQKKPPQCFSWKRVKVTYKRLGLFQMEEPNY